MKLIAAALAVVVLATPVFAQPAARSKSQPGRAQPKAAAPSRDAGKVDPRAVLHALEEAFTAVADRVTPAVVNVSAVPDKSATGGGG
jgi:hypothetical protein